jgi:hypothetical protein
MAHGEIRRCFTTHLGDPTAPLVQRRCPAPVGAGVANPRSRTVVGATVEVPGRGVRPHGALNSTKPEGVSPHQPCNEMSIRPAHSLASRPRSSRRGQRLVGVFWLHSPATTARYDRKLSPIAGRTTSRSELPAFVDDCQRWQRVTPGERRSHGLIRCGSRVLISVVHRSPEMDGMEDQTGYPRGASD